MKRDTEGGACAADTKSVASRLSETLPSVFFQKMNDGERKSETLRGWQKPKGLSRNESIRDFFKRKRAFSGKTRKRATVPRGAAARFSPRGAR